MSLWEYLHESPILCLFLRALAYTVPYAIGNILLTLSGPVIVAIVHAMRG